MPTPNANDLSIFEQVLSRITFRDVAILALLALTVVLYQDRRYIERLFIDEVIATRVVGECVLTVERDNWYISRGVHYPGVSDNPGYTLALQLIADDKTDLETANFTGACNQLSAIVNSLNNSQ
jgi:hypothetical protein